MILLGNLIRTSQNRRGNNIALEPNDEDQDVTFRYRKIPSITFKENKYKNYCGVEIECINSGHKQFTKEELRDYKFCKVHDGSLSMYGLEFDSQPLQGDNMLQIIKRFTTELKNRGYTTDSTCGTHIHLGFSEKDLLLIKKLYTFYSKYEDYFFKMLLKGRDNNIFCRRFRGLDKYSYEDILNVKSLEDFKKMYYETNFYFKTAKNRHGYKKRYCWANFHSLFYRGTLEIRSHEGTIDGDEIVNWLMLHLRLINYLKTRPIEEVKDMKINEKDFLSIFTPEQKKYIKSRWELYNNPNVAEPKKELPISRQMEIISDAVIVLSGLQRHINSSPRPS
jgi:hypothetical protein